MPRNIWYTWFVRTAALSLIWIPVSAMVWLLAALIFPGTSHTLLIAWWAAGCLAILGVTSVLAGLAALFLD